MPATALALVLAAALLHALWNVAAKRAGGDHRFVFMSALLVGLVWAPLGLWLAWDTVPHWGALEWGVMLASGVTHLLYFNVLLAGYRASDLTVVYPLARGTGPLLTTLGAVLWLGERPGWLALAGMLLVCGGVFVVAGGPALWAQAHDPARRARVVAGLRWGSATGAFIAGYTLIDGYAVKVLALSPILVDWFGNLLRLPFTLPAVLRGAPGSFREAWRAQWRHALLVAVFGPLAYVLVLYAVTLAPLSHVAPAREVSMLFAALVGGRLLGEGDRGARIAGALCIAAGVAALSIG